MVLNRLRGCGAGHIVGAWQWACLVGEEGLDLPEEAAVPLGDVTGAINSDHVGVEVPNFHHHSCLVPGPGGSARLILQVDMVTNIEWR